MSSQAPAAFGSGGSAGAGGTSRVPSALWPAAGLLGLVLPLSFLERVQSYLFYLSPLELWPVFGTTTLIHLPFALLLAVLALLLQFGLNRLPSGKLALLGGGRAAGTLVLAAVVALGLYYSLGHWLPLVDSQSRWSGPLPRLRWWVLTMVALSACLPAFAQAVRNLVGVATAVALLALLAALTLPLTAWPGAPQVVSPAQAAAGIAQRPNVLLLTFDALSAQHLSLYGARRPTSPELDRFAQGGTTFERFYAASNFTTSSVNSILTGQLPDRHGAMQLPSWPARSAIEHSLPAALKQAGYRNVAVSTNPLAGPYKNGYGASFDAVVSDRIQTYFSGRDGPSRWLKYLGPTLDNPFINLLWRPIALARWAYASEQAANLHYDPELVFSSARALIDQRPAGQPLFMWLHLLPPHSPYAAPAPFLGQFDARPGLRRIDDTTPPFMFDWGQVPAEVRSLYEARYDESVRYLDARAGAFLREALQRLGPNTIVLISADHGESFSHGYGGHAGPLLTEPLVRVPLIVRGPGIAAGARVAQPVSQIDLAPTIAALTGAPSQAPWQGRSLLPALRGEPLPEGATAWSMNLEQNPRGAVLKRGAIVVVDGRWKLVHILGEPRYAGAPPLHDQLFDVVADPGETNELSAEQPAELERLRGLVERYKADAAGQPAQ
jgi:arylsulfatase A-like enzyme